jgi:hypothetical protein
LKPEGVETEAGEIFEADHDEALELIGAGAAEAVTVHAITIDTDAELLIAIAAAATVEALEALLPEHEPSEGVRSAFEAKFAAFEK